MTDVMGHNLNGARSHLQATETVHRHEAIEFKLIVFMTFWIFLLGAIVMRLSGSRPKVFDIETSQTEPRRSIFGEAWAMASASIAYAFNMK